MVASCESCHGFISCIEIRGSLRVRYSSSFTSRDRRSLERVSVISDDVSGVMSCPKCGGDRSLRFGEGSWLEDAVWCVYCGWRPGAKLGGGPR